jgi:hypothetical protein
MTALVPTHRCGAVPDSHRVPSYDAPAWLAGRTDYSRQDRGSTCLPAATVMIEETARHAGHADILRELTDGATGVVG